jgi:uncharacterized protein (TIGR00730 family)
MDSPSFSLCVYCGSKPGTDPAFTQAAIQVGTWIGQHAGQLVYGGGRNGLMGIVADATLAAGGRVIGVISACPGRKRMAHTGCTELHIVETMHERKQMMAEKADAFVALPGGIGTFEEFFEVWTWRQLGYHNKPIGLLNIADYYKPMLNFLDSVVQKEFMGEWQMDLIQAHANLSILLPNLIQAAGLPITFQSKAI